MTILKDMIANLHPAYFAMVMATGIVSIASNLLGMKSIANGLFIFNAVVFATLCILTVLRLFLFPQKLIADLTDHKRGVGFFTMIAGAGVFGNQWVLIGHNLEFARVFWYASIGLWLGLTYVIFTGFTIKENKPPLEEGINGGWLLAVVATQSVSTLGSLLVPTFSESERLIVVFYSLVMWLCGGMLYIWLIALIFYRYTFFKFLPSDFAPPYWINMGAVSITTLGGTRIISNSANIPFLQSLLPFLKGFTLFFWATGTWWIPMLFILAIWRHVYKRYPFTYDPLYWGLVFPLGMYTVCTYHLARVLELPFLYVIPRYFIFVAQIVWVIVFAGFLRSLIRGVFPRSSLLQSKG